jgi:hypothetical protein
LVARHADFASWSSAVWRRDLVKRVEFARVGVAEAGVRVGRVGGFFDAEVEEVVEVGVLALGGRNRSVIEEFGGEGAMALVGQAGR